MQNARPKTALIIIAQYLKWQMDIVSLVMCKGKRMGCEICGENIECPKREDNINVCDDCNNKFPIPDENRDAHTTYYA